MLPRNLIVKLDRWLESHPEVDIPEGVLSAFLGRQSVERSAPTPAPNARIGERVDLNIDQKIPAYGHAMGGPRGEFVMNGNHIADLLAPPSLRGVCNAYAVYVAGDSMTPRYDAGEVVFINPGLPVRRGDYVVAQVLAERDMEEEHIDADTPLAFVKKFISMDATRLRLEKFNPAMEIEFPTELVVSVHKIVMGGER